jgi:HK97 family phage major capsid protein
MSKTLDVLRGQWDSEVATLTQLEEKITTEGREPSEGEIATMQIARTNIARLAEQIKDVGETEASIARTRDLLAGLPQPNGSFPGMAQHGQLPRVRAEGTSDIEVVRSIWATPGDYMADVLDAYRGDTVARERIQRAIAHSVTGDVPGLVPEPIVGELINVIDASRPATASLRSYPMPQYGSSFTRPKVMQHTEVGIQTTQKTELASRKFLVDPLQVNKLTFGGSINVAFQVVDWTNPSALNAITNDLGDQYAIQTEEQTCSVIEAAATANVANKVQLVAGAEIAGFYDAAAKVYAGCKRLPDTIYASVDMWAWLGGLVDAAKRPLLPSVGPSNAAGSMDITSRQATPLGARLVVSPGFAAGTLIVAASAFGEAYEDRRGGLRVVEPQLLGWEIAYYGYFAALATANGAFVKVDKPVAP